MSATRKEKRGSGRMEETHLPKQVDGKAERVTFQMGFGGAEGVPLGDMLSPIIWTNTSSSCDFLLGISLHLFYHVCSLFIYLIISYFTSWVRCGKNRTIPKDNMMTSLRLLFAEYNEGMLGPAAIYRATILRGELPQGNIHRN